MARESPVLYLLLLWHFLLPFELLERKATLIGSGDQLQTRQKFQMTLYSHCIYRRNLAQLPVGLRGEEEAFPKVPRHLGVIGSEERRLGVGSARGFRG